MYYIIFSVNAQSDEVIEEKGENKEADMKDMKNMKVTVRTGTKGRQLSSDNKAELTANKSVSYFYNSSHTQSNNYLPLNNIHVSDITIDSGDTEPVLSRREILIITITSIVAVILVVIAAVVVIWKVNS